MKNSLLRFTLAASMMGALVHCGPAQTLDDEPPAPPVTKPFTLKMAPSCDSLLSHFKEKITSQQTQALTIDDIESKFCQNTLVSDEMGASDAAPSMPSPDSYTQTNLQEALVDEPDIMKTNGQHVFVTHANGIDVFKAWPADEVDRVATIRIEKSLPAANIKSLSPSNTHPSPVNVDTFSSRPKIMLQDNLIVLIGEESYGDSRIVVLDVSNVLAAKVIEDLSVRSLYVDARIIGTTLHAVFNRNMYYWQIKGLKSPQYDYGLVDDLCSGNESQSKKAETKLRDLYKQVLQENIAKINQMTLADLDLPSIRKNGVEKQVDCGNFAEDQSDETSLATIYSLDLKNTSKDQATVVAGAGYHIYASTRSLYLTSQKGYNWWTQEGSEETIIHRFGLGLGSALHAYQATGSVPGHILNSFSLGEHEGFLRIATTSGQLGAFGITNETSNQVYVLHATAADLPVVGAIEGIAEGETIYAVRFIGKRGYVVTFKKVDPLFVLDLSNPRQPAIAGELKMPGFSTYLHPINERFVLGIGHDAQDMGNFAWFQGVKLALFDVSDPSSPKIKDEILIGERGTTSDAINNHHAVTYDAASGLLALPITYYSGNEDGGNYGDFEYNGFHVYHVSAAGISPKAVIQINQDYNGDSFWGGYDTDRAILMNEGQNHYLYGLLGDELITVDMAQPGEFLSEASLSETFQETIVVE